MNLTLQSKNIANLDYYFNKYFQKFLKEDVYLVAVSTGPDSTFLLHFLIKNNFKNLIVCYVNYNTRKNCQKEERHLKTFCEKNRLTLKILSYNKKITSNFQETARNIRYYYFFKILKSFQAKGIFLGHQKDDLSENIAMKTKKDCHFILKKITNFYQFKIFRPLLEIEKNAITNFLNHKKIKYFVDESNNLPIYKRNQIRKKLPQISKKNFEIENNDNPFADKKFLEKQELEEIYQQEAFYSIKNFIYQNSKAFLWKKITTNKCKNFTEQAIKSKLRDFYFIIENKHYLVIKNKKIYFLNWFFHN
ncbi:tRNA lysidine(34) synthetase TilS [symbiont of Argiope bruennichi]|uniref:tRNA lysidine(34) synthetase TilS n=1 Tax=symbiont of Argiope bruennichi TaxID=2810479 RepID=UPI003DA639DA